MKNPTGRIQINDIEITEFTTTHTDGPDTFDVPELEIAYLRDNSHKTILTGISLVDLQKELNDLLGVTIPPRV